MIDPTQATESEQNQALNGVFGQEEHLGTGILSGSPVFPPESLSTPPEIPAFQPETPSEPTPQAPQSLSNVFPGTPTSVTNERKGTVEVDAAAWERIMKVVERSERGGNEAIDLNNMENRKKIIRIAVYRDLKGEEHIVTGYNTKFFRDGSRTDTYQEGLDELTKKPITWCDPVLVSLKNGTTSTEKIKYLDFINLLVTVPMEVKEQKTERVEMTTTNEIIDVVTFQETGSNGRITQVPTGQKVKASVWGVTTKALVEYEGKEYLVDETVFNIK